MKILEFIEKKKTWIMIIAAILFVFVITIAMLKYEILGQTKLLKSYTFGSVTAIDDSVVLNEGQTVEQTYSNDNFNYKELGFVVHAADDEAELNVKIVAEGKTQELTLQKTDLLAGYTYVQLAEEVITKDPVELTITLTAQKGNFVVSANKSTTIENSVCKLDGEAINTNVVVDVRTVKTAANSGKFIGIGIAVVLFLIALVVLIKIQKADIAMLTAIILSFFCVICMVMFPPFTVPDEKTHYLSAYHVSNMQRFDFGDEAKALRMRQCDFDYVDSGSNSLYAQGFIKEKGFDEFITSQTQTITTKFGYMTNKVVPHFAAGLGINAARLFHLGPYWTFQLARLFNAAMCIIMIYFAIKIIPYGKIALAAISLIPINLHITASCSYDNFTYGGILLLFAYIIKLIHTDKKTCWKQLALLAIMVSLVVPQKIVYIGVAALVLLIPKDNFAKPKWHFAFKCALGVIAVVAIFAFQLNNAAKVTAETVTNSSTQGYNIGYVLQHPGEMVVMLYRTIINQGDFYFKSMISFFGWFEFQTPWFMAIPYIVVLMFAFMRQKDELCTEPFVSRAYSLILFGVVFLLIEFLLLVDHTPMGSSTVLGVQGRYFLPALPLLFFAVRNSVVEIKKNFNNILIFGMTFMNGLLFIYSASKIL